MSSMTDGFENAIILHLFNNSAITNVGDASGLPAAATAGVSQLALYTSALTDADTVLNAGSEVAYTGYSRPQQARSSAGWTVTNAQAANTALIVFGEMTAGGPDTVVHLGLGLMAANETLRLHQDLNADLVINNGVNPQFAIGALTWTAA